MAHISIRREHTLSLKKAREAAEAIANDLQKKFDLDYEWDGDQLNFERPGVSGEMQVGKEDVTLDVQLGFLLLPLKGRIEAEIQRKMDELFGKT